ncbi:MAG: T9SS type A sorting domain-containing protein [Bacteroidetes bacterium]|nr:T9SS type A sorting domain-containing protein [Bacteroidota bacterium]
MGLLVYSDSLSQAMSSITPMTIGYYWWVAEGTTLMPCIYGTPYMLYPVIHTDDQAGTFYLDYMIGDNGVHLNHDRSDHHLITVGLHENITVTNANDNGPGSLREAIDQVDFYGTIDFNLNAGDTILLQEQLDIHKDINITGHTDMPVVISGNHQSRVMYIDDSRNPQFSDVHIVHGNADNGGGIYCGANSIVTLRSVTIAHNTANNGGGIYIDYGANVILDSINYCNVFLNKSSSGLGADIFASTFTNLMVDTFSVLYPTKFYLYPYEYFTCNIQNSKIHQVDADLYVSPAGDNSNSGLTSGEPLKTIRYAFSLLRLDSLHQNSIYLLNGTYSPSINAEPFPINMLNYLSIIGESESGVILDAEGSSVVMIIENESLNNLRGITITGGLEEPFGHAVKCLNSNVDFEDITITDNKGGGIYFWDSFINMEDVKITNNSMSGVVASWGGRGGGIYGIDSDLNLKNVLVSNNKADYTGGGIFLESSSAMMEGVTVSYNKAYYGGGIYAYYWTNVIYDSLNRCNIYLNEANYGNDIKTNGLVVVDTFTVLHPSKFHAEGDIEFDILHAKKEQAETDLYVSPGGDDENSGLTAEDPLKTIRFAELIIRADTASQHTIRLLEGIYGPSYNGEKMPVYIKDYISICGENTHGVILDAEDQSGVMHIDSDIGTKISNLTITGGNEHYGAGLFCSGNSEIENLIVRNNTAVDGAGIDVNGEGTFLKNVLVMDNNAQYCGGIACRNGGQFTAENITVTNNTGGRAGGIYLGNGAAAVMRNSIISGNNGYAVSFLSFNSWNYFMSSWSNINGWVNTNSNGSFTHTGIYLSEDPLFDGTGDHPFALSEGSPCIDAGNPVLTGNIPEWDLIGNQRVWDGDGNGEAIIDMGAYEFGSLPVGDEELLVTGCGINVYPNPCSNVVRLRLTTNDYRLTVCDLYTISGLWIRRLVNEVMPAGVHEMELDVSALPEGVYLVRLQAGDGVVTKKLVKINACLP